MYTTSWYSLRNVKVFAATLISKRNVISNLNVIPIKRHNFNKKIDWHAYEEYICRFVPIWAYFCFLLKIQGLTPNTSLKLIQKVHVVMETIINCSTNLQSTLANHNVDITQNRSNEASIWKGTEVTATYK